MIGFGGTDHWRGAIEGKVSPYVIWIDVKSSDDLVNLFNKLRNDITSKEETWLPRIVDFVPHITLAFIDLNKEGYEKGLRYLDGKEMDREFDISQISLVKCHGEGNMTSAEYKIFDLIG